MKKAHVLLWLGMQWAAAQIHITAQIFVGETEIDTATVVSGLDTPWEILWGPDDHIWITERMGRVSRLNPQTGEKEVIAQIGEVNEQGEGGLLGMTLHPDFMDNPYLFLVYNYLENSVIRERLVRFKYESGSLADPVTLLEGIAGAGNHNGSRVVIDSAQMLYMTTGDAANTSLSQNLNSLNGKVLRLHLDGSIPEDNPFPGSPVWTWGHRNPQGLILAPSGMLYSSEHGPSTDDELNRIEKGRNYGWPTVKGFCDEVAEQDFCADSGVFEPLAAWTPTLAVAGIDFYSHPSIPAWNNAILVTALKSSRLVAVKMSEDGISATGENHYFENWFGRLRDLCVSPAGDLYLAVSNRDGRGTVRPGDDRIVRISAAADITGITGKPAGGDETFRIYPNPVNGDRLQIDYTPSGNASLSVYNEWGSLIHEGRIFPGQHNLELTFPGPAGLYLVRIRDGNRVFSKMVVKQ